MNALTRPFQGPLTGRRFLSYMIAFFAVIFTVNGIFVFVALDSWPGLTTHRAYDEGLAYNRTLENAAQQEALGWRSRAALGGATPKGRILTVEVIGPDGPVEGLQVTADLVRPLGEGTHIPLTLTSQGGGRYGALVLLPSLGRWRLNLDAQQGGASMFRMSHDLMTDQHAK